MVVTWQIKLLVRDEKTNPSVKCIHALLRHRNKRKSEVKNDPIRERTKTLGTSLPMDDAQKI